MGEVSEEEVVEDLAGMLRKFVLCQMYTFVDKLANATGKEVVQSTLYEALRIARSAYDADRSLCEGEGFKVTPYVARESTISYILTLLDRDPVRGLELVKRAAVKALSFPVKEEKGEV